MDCVEEDMGKILWLLLAVVFMFYFIGAEPFDVWLVNLYQQHQVTESLFFIFDDHNTP